MAKLGEQSPELQRILNALTKGEGESASGHYQQDRRSRRLTNYEKCMADIKSMGTRGLFAECKGVRIKKRVACHVQRGGTVETTITTKRFQGSRIICVCKSRIF